MRSHFTKSLVALAGLVMAALVLAPVSALMQDQVIPRRQPITCPSSGAIYPYYSTTDQSWHCTATAPAFLNASSVTATATELNKLAGVTAGTVTASKALVVDANSALNVVRTASLRIGTSGSETAVTSSGTELNYVDVTTLGTIEASKALTADANKAVDTLRAKTDFALGGTGVPGAAVVADHLTKTVTAIADNTATDVLTVTVPNAQHLAQIQVCLTGVLGAGGAIGAGEAAATNCYIITVVRTAGVATVATASSAFGAAASNVAGAGTCTAVVTLSAMTGAVSVTQTFTIKATIVKSGGSSANHVAFVVVRLLNGNATGVTIA